MSTKGRKRDVPTTSSIIIAVMKGGDEWTPSALWRHMKAHGIRKSYGAVKKALYRLHKKGVVTRVRKGWYVLKGTRPTHGVGKAPASPVQESASSPTPSQPDMTSWTSNFGHPDLPRIHDIWLIAEDLPPWLNITSTKKTLRIGRTEVQITLGAKRRKITVVIENTNPGLDYDAFSAIMEVVRRELVELVGWFDASVFAVRNIHFNIDVFGMRLDGVKSLTLTAFDDWFARIYQKGEKARVEVGRNDVSVAQVAAILQGGFSGAQALTYIAALHQQFSDVARNLQFLLEQQKQFLRFQQALLQRMGGVS